MQAPLLEFCGGDPVEGSHPPGLRSALLVWILHTSDGSFPPPICLLIKHAPCPLLASRNSPFVYLNDRSTKTAFLTSPAHHIPAGGAILWRCQNTSKSPHPGTKVCDPDCKLPSASFSVCPTEIQQRYGTRIMPL